MAGISIVMRTPCKVHDDCDETHCRIMHTDKKYAELTEEERRDGGHDFCEGDLPKIRKALLSTGSWTCPVCGQTHTYKDKKLTPNIVQLYQALEAS